jgi:hypothetical protein
LQERPIESRVNAREKPVHLIELQALPTLFSDNRTDSRTIDPRKINQLKAPPSKIWPSKVNNLEARSKLPNLPLKVISCETTVSKSVRQSVGGGCYPNSGVH